MGQRALYELGRDKRVRRILGALTSPVRGNTNQPLRELLGAVIEASDVFVESRLAIPHSVNSAN